METIPNPKGPDDPPSGVEVPDGDVREPPLPDGQRSERFPGKNEWGGGIEKDA
jgi:hypothetical protein